VRPETGDGADRGSHNEVVEFGTGRRASRGWLSRALLVGLVLVTAVIIAVHGGGGQARSAAPKPPPPPVRVTTTGHRLLGVTAGWELFARGTDDLLRIQLARGQITQTYVPPLDSPSPDVALAVGAREAVIRSADYVPGYVIPDGQQARLLTGPLAGGGPLVPGPAAAHAAWVPTGPPTSPALALVTLTGRRSGPAIRFPSAGQQLPATAVSDGRGYVLVTTRNFTVYDAGPGWDRQVPGTVLAVGPASWLIVTCDPQYRHCHNEIIGTTNKSRRVLPGPATAVPYYLSWPPTGVIAPDGSAAAVAGTGPGGGLSVHLIDLRSGATRDLDIPLGEPGSDVPDSNVQSMAWSPDSRWLFVAAAGGKLVAVNARTGKADSLGVTLPPVDQVAIRA
jgi:hypothetical protein